MYIHKYFFCRLMRGSRACHACWLSAVCGLIIRLNATVLRTGGNIGQFNPKGSSLSQNGFACERGTPLRTCAKASFKAAGYSFAAAVR